MSDGGTKQFLFVIDTDEYSGNFEREMCAYVTGRVGDCGVGEEEAAIFDDEAGQSGTDMGELVCENQDNHGCYRPTTVWPTPGWWNDGNGRHYRDGKGPKRKNHCPAYQSVGIWMVRKPAAKEIKFMKERARAFSNHRSIAKISGFRLVTQKTTESSKKL